MAVPLLFLVGPRTKWRGEEGRWPLPPHRLRRLGKGHPRCQRETHRSRYRLPQIFLRGSCPHLSTRQICPLFRLLVVRFKQRRSQLRRKWPRDCPLSRRGRHGLLIPRCHPCLLASLQDQRHQPPPTVKPMNPLQVFPPIVSPLLPLVIAPTRFW